MRWEKTLALAHALQACTERLGVPIRVPCDSVTELQRCMASLMCLSRDKIEETSLLGPAGEECGTSPTLEEEAILLGEEPEPLDDPEATYLPECLEIP